jgi:hypothetical protein
MLNGRVEIEKQYFRKQHSITNSLVAQKIGNPTHPGLARDTQETEDFF